jgi:hypothetical protein
MCEIQHNLDDSAEIDKAIAELRPEALEELREDCLASIDRQSDIIARIQSRSVPDVQFKMSADTVHLRDGCYARFDQFGALVLFTSAGAVAPTKSFLSPRLSTTCKRSLRPDILPLPKPSA